MIFSVFLIYFISPNHDYKIFIFVFKNIEPLNPSGQFLFPHNFYFSKERKQEPRGVREMANKININLCYLFTLQRYILWKCVFFSKSIVIYYSFSEVFFFYQRFSVDHQFSFKTLFFYFIFWFDIWIFYFIIFLLLF